MGKELLALAGMLESEVGGIVEGSTSCVLTGELMHPSRIIRIASGITECNCTRTHWTTKQYIAAQQGLILWSTYNI